MSFEIDSLKDLHPLDPIEIFLKTTWNNYTIFNEYDIFNYFTDIGWKNIQ